MNNSFWVPLRLHHLHLMHALARHSGDSNGPGPVEGEWGAAPPTNNTGFPQRPPLKVGFFVVSPWADNATSLVSTRLLLSCRWIVRLV